MGNVKVEPIVKIENMSFFYQPNRPVLQDVSLRIASGEFASIVGPNGSGKTTLVRLMLGLLTPTSGRIELFGDAPRRTRHRVGYTPQMLNVDRLFPMSVDDVVLTGRLGRIEGVGASPWFGLCYSAADRRCAAEAMEKMRVGDLAKKSFGSLSGGERQRVLIARALCCAPELLILDEPTNNVDPSNSQFFYDLLSELNRETTVLLVSHDFGVVSHRVRSVICVNGIVAVHPTSELNGRSIQDIYGSDVDLIRHDHRCSETGHLHFEPTSEK